MWPELINLLPNDYSRLLRREYLMRLVTVALIGIALVVIVNGVFLIPSYIYEQQQIIAETQQLNHLNSGGASTQENQINKQLLTLSQQATVLSSLTSAPMVSNSLKSILAVPRPGVTLSSFVYSAPGKGPGSMQISGMASTRESLRSFNASLSALPFVTNSNLPIEDYAQANNIAFTITLTGSFAPK